MPCGRSARTVTPVSRRRARNVDNCSILPGIYARFAPRHKAPQPTLGSRPDVRIADVYLKPNTRPKPPDRWNLWTATRRNAPPWFDGVLYSLRRDYPPILLLGLFRGYCT